MYAHSDPSYSSLGKTQSDVLSSLWLTAFVVVKCFGLTQLYKCTDKTVLSKSIDFFIRHKDRDECFSQVCLLSMCSPSHLVFITPRPKPSQLHSVYFQTCCSPDVLISNPIYPLSPLCLSQSHCCFYCCTSCTYILPENLRHRLQPERTGFLTLLSPSS